MCKNRKTPSYVLYHMRIHSLVRILKLIDVVDESIGKAIIYLVKIVHHYVLCSVTHIICCVNTHFFNCFIIQIDLSVFFRFDHTIIS